MAFQPKTIGCLSLVCLLAALTAFFIGHAQAEDATGTSGDIATVVAQPLPAPATGVPGGMYGQCTWLTVNQVCSPAPGANFPQVIPPAVCTPAGCACPSGYTAKWIGSRVLAATFTPYTYQGMTIWTCIKN